MAKIDLSITKERTAELAAALQLTAGKHAHGLEVEVDTDFDPKGGWMEVTLTFNHAGQIAAIDKFKAQIARQIKAGTFGQEEEGEEEPAPRRTKAAAAKPAAKPAAKAAPAKSAKAKAKPAPEVEEEEEEEEGEEVTLQGEVLACLQGELEDFDGDKYGKHIEAALANKPTPLDKYLGKLLDDKDLVDAGTAANINALYLALALFEFEDEHGLLSKLQAKRLTKAGEVLESYMEETEEEGEEEEEEEEEEAADDVVVTKRTRR